MNVKFPHVVADKSRHGRVRYYYRRPGRAKIRLPDDPTSAAFLEAYHAAKAAHVIVPPKLGRKRSPDGTVAGAIAAYYQHNSFQHGLAPSTQAMRRAILERLRAEHGDKPIAGLERKHIAVMLGKMKPYAAHNWLKTLRGLMAFAVEVELLAEDPTENIKRAKAKASTGFHSWSEGEIAQYEAHHPVGSRPRLALALLLYTAQRRGDIVRLGPQHVSGRTITVRPQKTERTTAKTLLIPLHSELAAVLAATPTGHLSYLVTGAGAPFSPAGFGNWFRDCCNEAGLPHCTAHGLRKAQCRRLAEAGCSEHQIAAITGHDSLALIRLYTRAAAQEQLAAAAYAQIDAAASPPLRLVGQDDVGGT
jgi:integrase